MRSFTALAVAAVFIVAPVVSAASAQAVDTPPPNEIIQIDINVLGCAIGAGLGAEVASALTAGTGSNAAISGGLATRLRVAGCLPWRR